MSALKTLLMRYLRVDACGKWKQAYTLKLLKISNLRAV